MPPKGKRRALSVSSSIHTNEVASVIDETPNIRRSKRRKVEPTEIELQPPSQESKPVKKGKITRRQPKKVKKFVKEEDTAEEPEPTADASQSQSTAPVLEEVVTTGDLNIELENLRRQIREKEEVRDILSHDIQLTPKINSKFKRNDRH